MSKRHGSSDCRVVQSLVNESFKFFTSEDSFRIDSLDKVEIERTAKRIVDKGLIVYITLQECERKLVNLLKMIESAIENISHRMDTRE